MVDDVLVCSCLVMGASAVGQEIVTIEGVAPVGAPSDVQQAFVDAGAVQCGFCTPGLVMAVHDLLERTPGPTETEIREELAGNVCRCTGYGRIIDAVQRVAVQRAAGDQGRSA
jgi:carbon-monoxide dehydrogenase small subunit